jgi:NitT/TauT family transport system ATP-binding protein
VHNLRFKKLPMSSVSSPTDSSVEVRSLGRIFPGGVAALESLDLTIRSGEFLAILGPSGCGKSTLLRLIAGLDSPTTGSIHRAAAELAYVFQDAHLLPWRNVLSNIVLPLELKGVDHRERHDRAIRVIEQVGLSDAVDRYPAQLSGGMRMRVSLARALITDPKLLLLDEPFAALDEITRQRLDEQLRELWIEHKITTIFVTHSTNEATFLAQRAIVLSPRPGRIVLDMPIDLPKQRSSSLRGTPEFAGQTRLLYDALEHGGGK